MNFIISHINSRTNSDVNTSNATANTNVNVEVNDYVDSPIEIPKKIVGLEDVEITFMNIKSSANSSLIEISFKNTSILEINNCKVNLYLLDENESVIWGTLLNLPNLEPDSSKTFNILCSDNITNISDYKVVISN